MRKARQRYAIRSEKQLGALGSAARQEIIDVLADMGTVSAAEIAAALERPADALYFHLHALKQAGLVHQAGYRSRKGHKEELFRTIAPNLSIHYQPRSESNRRAVTAIVGSMLRLGIRDFRRAFQRTDVIVSGAERELWALRKTGRLSLAQIAGINRSIERLARAVSKPHGRGRLYAIVVLLTPVDHRRLSKRSPKSQGDGRK